MQSPVRIVVVSAQPQTSPGHWNVTWQVSNVLADYVVIEDAWIPHGRFRGEGHVTLSDRLAPGAMSTVELSVASDEPRGTVVKNAFLILRVRGAEHAWRAFARMRIEFRDSGMTPILESVTAQSLD